MAASVAGSPAGSTSRGQTRCHFWPRAAGQVEAHTIMLAPACGSRLSTMRYRCARWASLSAKSSMSSANRSGRARLYDSFSGALQLSARASAPVATASA
jgi:hypothetical protein